MPLASVLVPAWPPHIQCEYQDLSYHGLYNILLLLQEIHASRIFKSASLFEENYVGWKSRSVSASQVALGVTEKEFVLFKTSSKNRSTFLEETKENSRLQTTSYLLTTKCDAIYNCWDSFWIDDNKGQFSDKRQSLTKEIFILAKEEGYRKKGRHRRIRSTEEELVKLTLKYLSSFWLAFNLSRYKLNHMLLWSSESFSCLCMSEEVEGSFQPVWNTHVRSQSDTDEYGKRCHYGRGLEGKVLVTLRTVLFWITWVIFLTGNQIRAVSWHWWQ